MPRDDHSNSTNARHAKGGRDASECATLSGAGSTSRRISDCSSSCGHIGAASLDLGARSPGQRESCEMEGGCSLSLSLSIERCQWTLIWYFEMYSTWVQWFSGRFQWCLRCLLRVLHSSTAGSESGSSNATLLRGPADASRQISVPRAIPGEQTRSSSHATECRGDHMYVSAPGAAESGIQRPATGCIME